MQFPENGVTGYATEERRILKTINMGASWTVLRFEPNFSCNGLQCPDINTAYTFTGEVGNNKLIKTVNGGSDWLPVSTPVIKGGSMRNCFFLTTSSGWLHIADNNLPNKNYVYKTTTGGSSWTLLTSVSAGIRNLDKMQFADDNTGYALAIQNTVYKTLNGGVLWEPLPRDNSFNYLLYSHRALNVFSSSQLWAGGRAGFIELSTNGGGTPLPKGYFEFDTTGVWTTKTVKLLNYSNPAYQFKWFVNNKLVSSAYNYSYTHVSTNAVDTVMLVVIANSRTDTLIKSQNFYLPGSPVISSFTPASGNQYQAVYIYGKNLLAPDESLPTVTVGGVPVLSVKYYPYATPYLLIYPGIVASGCIKVSHFGGADSVCGFSFIAPPAISSFTPASASPNDTILIKGKFFLSGPPVVQVLFGNRPAAGYEVLNDSTIKAVVAHGGSGNVSVVKSSGTAVKTGFTFIPLPPPVISSFSPNNVLTGTTITVTGNNLWGITLLKVGNTIVKDFTPESLFKLSFVLPVNASGRLFVSTYYGADSLSLPLLQSVPPPAITSLSPSYGVPGDEITIHGNNFGTDVSKVLVFFSGIKAVVTSVAINTIKVVVPKFAGYSKVTVIANNLVSQSSNYFITHNPNIANEHLTENAFKVFGNVSGGIGGDRLVKSADFNNDGKPDVIALGENDINIYINKSKESNIHMQPAFVTPSLQALRFDIGEIDGDGKPDLAIYQPNTFVNCAINTSTKDSIKFEYHDGRLANGFTKMIDINGDGKLDLIMAGVESGYPITASINNSIPGYVNFKESIELKTLDEDKYFNLVNIADVDNDGLPDMIGESGSIVKVFRNIGTSQEPDFRVAPVVLSVITGTSIDYNIRVKNVEFADMNLDGKPDLLVTHSAYNTATFAMYKNLSIPGKIQFAKFQLVNNCPVNSSFSLSDLNGDKKPDVIVGDYSWFYFYENKSTSDSIILGDKVSISGGGGNACIMDVDGDNKQDVVSSSYGKLLYMRNILGEYPDEIVCPNAGMQFTSNVNGSNYQWQIGTDSIFVNLAADATVNGVNTAILSLSKIPSSWQSKTLRCRVDNVTYSRQFKIRVQNTWKGFVDNNWSNPANWSCGIVPDKYTSVVIPSSKYISVNQDASCWSISLGNYSNLSLSAGVNFVILH